MAPTLRMIEREFGILPYPKLDETQRDYISSVSPLFLTVGVVPANNRNLQNTGIIMEEMGYMGYRDIRPAFYDILLQGKVARDEESLVTLDYIFNNITYDVGALLNIGNISLNFMAVPGNYDLNIASFIDKQQSVIQSSIDAIIEAFE